MTDDATDDGAASTRTTSRSYDIGDDESHSEAVVRAVAAFTDTPIVDLEPLYDTVDPTHLDGLFEDGALQESSISLEYEGCEVTVTPNAVHFRRDESQAS